MSLMALCVVLRLVWRGVAWHGVALCVACKRNTYVQGYIHPKTARAGGGGGECMCVGGGGEGGKGGGDLNFLEW